MLLSLCIFLPNWCGVKEIVEQFVALGHLSDSLAAGVLNALHHAVHRCQVGLLVFEKIVLVTLLALVDRDGVVTGLDHQGSTDQRFALDADLVVLLVLILRLQLEA